MALVSSYQYWMKYLDAGLRAGERGFRETRNQFAGAVAVVIGFVSSGVRRPRVSYSECRLRARAVTVSGRSVITKLGKSEREPALPGAVAGWAAGCG